MRKENRYFLYVTLIFVGVAIGVILTSNLNLTDVGQAQKRTALVDEDFSFPTGTSKSVSPASSDGFTNSFVEINKSVTPAVVSINSYRKVSYSDLKKYHDGDKRFWDLFPERLNPFRSPQKEFKQGGAGSGIIVHEDGYILTNTHVIEGATELQVTLLDNRTFHGKIVGIDPLTEVAVIKVDGDDLPAAHLGNSDDLQVGQWVMAIGNPLELRFTVTAGIISAIGRQMDIIRDVWAVENFIQTDAVINPGNSGGALVNLQGEVIGVNTAIATRSGFYEGYGFAIPINLAKAVMEDLITEGRVVRAYLGIQMQPMDQKKAKAYRMEKVEGVFIDQILSDSPASRGGLESEDILLEVDGIRIQRSNQVQSIIAQKDPGSEVEVVVFRNGEEKRILVVLEEREYEESQVAAVSTSSEETEELVLGLDVETLGRRRARDLNLEDVRGVLVTNVDAFSNAFEAGLRVDDLIIEVNSDDVADEDEFWKKIENLESGDVARLYVQRGQGTTHLFLELP